MKLGVIKGLTDPILSVYLTARRVRTARVAQAYVYALLYIQMRCGWDESKNRSNLRKHGISFDTAVRVFLDPLHSANRIELSTEKSVGEPSVG